MLLLSAIVVAVVVSVLDASAAAVVAATASDVLCWRRCLFVFDDLEADFVLLRVEDSIGESFILNRYIPSEDQLPIS
jgi:hypothetical protein